MSSSRIIGDLSVNRAKINDLNVVNLLDVDNSLAFPSLFNVQTMLSQAVSQLNGDLRLSNIETNLLSENSDFVKSLKFLTDKIEGVYYSYLYISSKYTNNYMGFHLHPSLPGYGENLLGTNSSVSEATQNALKTAKNETVTNYNRLMNVQYVFPAGSPPKRAFIFPMDIINDTGLMNYEELVMVFGCGY